MRRLGSAGPYLALALLPFLFYWKLFALDPEERSILRGDFLNQHFVWKSYTLSRVREGELPLWNPHVLGGVPFHANPQAGVFYPPTYLLLPFHEPNGVNYLALEAYHLLHLSLAGVGMLLFTGALGVGGIAALGASVIYMFTGFFTTPGHHAIAATASWLPWVLLATKRALSADAPAAPGRSVTLALSLAMMVLAGHPQVAYYGILLAVAWALSLAGWRGAVKRFAPALVLALGVAAVQLLPTYELARESARARLGYDYATSFGLPAHALPGALVPRGQIPLAGRDPAAPLHLYVGIGGLVLAAVALGLSPTRLRWFFAAASILALLLSMGRESFLYDLSYAALPGFDRFRVPYRLLGIYGLSMSVLAGLGLDVLARSGTSRRVRVRLSGYVKAGGLALLLLAAWAGYLHTRLSAEPGVLSPDEIGRVVGSAYFAVMLGVLNLGLLLARRAWPRERWVLPAIVALLVVDIGSFVKDRAQHPYRTLVRAGERPEHRYLRAQEHRARHATDSNLESYASLYGVDSAGGHEALEDASYRELLDAGAVSANALSLLNVKFLVGAAAPSRYPWCGDRYPSPLPLLDVPPSLSPAPLGLPSPLSISLLRVYWSPLRPGGEGSLEIEGDRHPLPRNGPLELAFDEPVRFTGFRVIVPETSAGVRIEDVEVDLNPIGLKADFLELDGVFLNLHALPRAYFMVPADLPHERFTAESLRCWSTQRGVQVTNPVTGEGASGFFRRDAVVIERYEEELVELRTRSPRDGYLVLSDAFRPGWVATVDGAAVPVYRAQLAMRAVPVARGEHTVRFTYRPRSLQWGALASSVSLVVLLAWSAIRRVRVRIRSDSSPESHRERSRP